MNLLLCDGPANGRWIKVMDSLEEGDTFEVAGGAYMIYRWPNGEVVGVSTSALDYT